MAWMVVNGILVVFAFAGILAVMIAGFRWHQRSEQAEQAGRADQRRRLEASLAVDAGGEMDAELATIVERHVLSTAGAASSS